MEIKDNIIMIRNHEIYENICDANYIPPTTFMINFEYYIHLLYSIAETQTTNFSLLFLNQFIKL